ncbi:NUDIX hydrolase [Macrococcus sp. DPC7161]|nr:NUDIX hydrolase [Macrococcus sp. DPC7161]
MYLRKSKVWLGVSGIVTNQRGEWLVLKKQYSGLKGKWSFPAGFVEAGEAIDDAIIREVKEETGIDCDVEGILGVRSGVIKNDISDNMIIFKLKATSEDISTHLPNDEIECAKWVDKQSLLNMECSPMIYEFVRYMPGFKPLQNTTSPGKVFNYTKYHLYY